jgi:hypothetical protein
MFIFKVSNIKIPPSSRSSLSLSLGISGEKKLLVSAAASLVLAQRGYTAIKRIEVHSTAPH